MESAQNKTQKFKLCEACKKAIHTSSFSRHLKSKVNLHKIGAAIPPEAGPPEPVQQQARAILTLKTLARAKLSTHTISLKDMNLNMRLILIDTTPIIVIARYLSNLNITSPLNCSI